MNRCRRIRPWIARSVDGDLEPGEAFRLARHLATCTACRIVLARVLGSPLLATTLARAGAAPRHTRHPGHAAAAGQLLHHLLRVGEALEQLALGAAQRQLDQALEGGRCRADRA